MSRLRIAIRPYWAERWVRRASVRQRSVVGRYAAAIAVAVVLLLLATFALGCRHAASDPRSLSEWDVYGCGDV